MGNKKRATIFVYALLVLALVSPVILYASQFGLGVWSSHSDWSAMGSALGGIYTDPNNFHGYYFV
jgi:hypothetical protein